MITLRVLRRVVLSCLGAACWSRTWSDDRLLASDMALADAERMFAAGTAR